MPKLRVYQLAKQLNVQSALILEVLDRMGQDVKSDLSTLESDTAELVRERVTSAIEAETMRLAEELRLEELRQAEEAQRLEAERKRVGAEEPEPVAAAGEEPTEPPRIEEPEAATPAAASAARAPASPAGAEVPKPGVAGPRKPRVFAAKRLVPHPSVRAKVGRPTPARPGTLRGSEAAPGVPPRPGALGARPLGTRPVRTAPPPPRPRRRKKGKKRELVPPPSRPKPELPPVPEKIILSEAVTVKELAEKLNRKSKDVIAKLITRGQLVTINQPLEQELAVEVAEEFGSQASIVTFEEEAQQTATAPVEAGEAATEAPEDRQPRPPVVTVMGHVDHGKTSLLDAIRATDVVAGEHGGITQHIGAYQVQENGRKVTFLDTPGHEAFTLMRARGAKVTDIVVLVVAADDGVKPQTLEAIDHAKAAGVPIVVAINKMDKPDAQPDRVKQQLADHELLVEEFGGSAVSCEVSAKKRTGIDELLEMILLVADLQELKANPHRPAQGVVLEAKLDRARGIVATLLIQDGTLKTGDPFIAGSTYGKVRAMNDEHGRRIDTAGPSMPVEVMGLAGEPGAGDMLQAVSEESKARQIASFRHEKVRAAALRQTAKRTLESLSKEIAEGEIKELPVLLKADVQGSLEALQKALGQLPSEKIRVNVLRSSTGATTRADVLLASAANAIVVGFNVRADRATAELAKREDVEIRLYTVIYDMISDIGQAMLGMLEPTLKETVLGQAAVRQLFKVPKIGIVAGCYVAEGKVARNAEVRLLRDNVVIYTGKVGSLRRFKEDVSEVKQGYECGIGIANYQDVKESDVIEFFVTEKVAVESL